MKKKIAKIDKWWMADGCLFGCVSNHSQQDKFKMEVQKTSFVIDLDLERGTAETENTIYELGLPKYWG